MSWTIDLSWGKQREQDFLKSVPHMGLKALDGFGPDFISSTGHYYELKSERRTAKETKNIAVETVSSFKRKGAIFNAQQSDYIVFFFACGATFYYRSADLLLVARAYRRKYGQIAVRNSNARVVLLPRTLLRRIEVNNAA
jgi:hypothetical protein